MADAFVYDAVRTPRGRGKKDGSLHEVPAVRLAARTLEAVRDRNGLDTSQVDDIIFGCVDPVGEAGSVTSRAPPPSRRATPPRRRACRSSRFCASGLDAINLGAAKIAGGSDEIVIAGGVEFDERASAWAPRAAPGSWTRRSALPGLFHAAGRLGRPDRHQIRLFARRRRRLRGRKPEARRPCLEEGLLQEVGRRRSRTRTG